ncbi:hypothetical protein ABF162_07535 [Vibrio coralliilyticus]|uniref:hypothetical protein n=1 Tax=Vibrio coralliilyticus TaxID=190893 RepID=UPI000A605761|nr:hypothetical protein [Vibrio coralliilyticus]
MEQTPPIRVYSDPIHLPCPDMAGCENFDPELTKKSASVASQLRAQLFPKSKVKKAKASIPDRFRGSCGWDEMKAIGHAVEVIGGEA